MLSRFKQTVNEHKLLVLSFIFLFIFSGAVSVFATPPTSPYTALQAITDPGCGPTDTNCRVTPLSIGETIGSGTVGSVLSATTSGALAQNNTNFFFDNTTNANYLTLGSGTAAGQMRFLEGSAGGTNYIALKSPATPIARTIWW